MSLKIPRGMNTTLDVIDNINLTAGPRVKRCRKCGKAMHQGSKNLCSACHASRKGGRQ